jgi:hypothetical protein
MEVQNGEAVSVTVSEGIAASVRMKIGADGTPEVTVTVCLPEEIKRTSHTPASDGSAT